VISIYPGQPAQVIHRDEFAWDGFKFPSDYDVQCNTLWAMSEYTDEIGATRVVPGSHTLSDHHTFTPADTVPAEMERGSVLMYTGKLYHGGGANRTADRVRKAINITYAVGWVRQEENQYLSTPLDVAKTLDDGLLRLMGYQMGNPVIGYINDNEDPISAIHGDRRPLDWSNVHISYADKK
jgi:ectoine hydroxylase-related dioxygenase (phytanoyl-CoA dioxygenase family)